MADFNSAIPFIKAVEGGLSRNPADTASKKPAPWAWKGKSGWHTNKGITYSTFVSMSKKIGYQVTPENFFLMPDRIWQAIFKTGYWDTLECDRISSKAVAIALVDYAFNFGAFGARKRLTAWLGTKYNLVATTPTAVATAINQLTAKGDKAFFVALIQHRREAYKKLNQPQNEEGWLARMDKLEKEGSAFVYEHKGSLAGVAFLVLLTFMAFQNREKIAALFTKA